MVTYTLNRTPVHRNRYDGASDSAKLMAEICERLLEVEEAKLDSAADLVRRLATLADLSKGAFRMVLHFGSGNTGALLASYEEQVAAKGITRQAAHWRWQQDLKAISFTFPEVASLMKEYRDSIGHREDAMSAADAMRDATQRRQEGEK